MPKSKNTRKLKHSFTKRHNRIANAKAKHTIVAWCNGQKGNKTFDTDGNQVSLDVQAATTLIRCAFPWTSLCVALCRDQLGKEYLQTRFIEAKAHYPYGAMAETINEIHQQLLTEVNPLHLVSVGWVASPAGAEISDTLADKILTKLGAWKYHNDWEASKIRKANQEKRKANNV